MNIFVGNLPRQASEEDLRQAFKSYGQIESVVIIKDRFSGESKGFGFIEMPAKSEAQAAMAGLNGSVFMGQPITVNEARPRSDRRTGGRPSGGGYRGGPRGGGQRGGGDRRGGGRRPY